MHNKDSSRKINKNYILQPCLLKQELEPDEIFEDNWEERENKWLPYLKKGAVSTAFSFARYTKRKKELTEFSMKKSLTLTSLTHRYFNNLRDENDEPIYTHNDEYLRKFTRRSDKGGLFSALNQY